MNVQTNSSTRSGQIDIPRVSSQPAHDKLVAAAADLSDRFPVSELDEAADQRAAWEFLVDRVPEAAELIANATTPLREHGVVIIEHFPVEFSSLLVACLSTLGPIIRRKSEGYPLVEEVKPVDDDGKKLRYSQTRMELLPHTDGTPLPTPPAYLTLSCVANDTRFGGETVVVLLDEIASHLEADAPGTVATLSANAVPVTNPPFFTIDATYPILGYDDAGNLTARWFDDSIRQALSRHNASVSVEVVEAIGRFETALANRSFWKLVSLQPGEVLILNNGRILHGRTEIAESAQRFLKRISVYPPEL